MSNQQREILHQHRHFLARNIVWSDNLINKLLANGVITETEVKDVQSGRDSKSGGSFGKRMLAKLIKVLPLRGQAVYEKFCNVLLLNGHSFIADFLKDEEKGTHDTVDLRALYKDLPQLDKVLKTDEKTLLESFITEKVKESSLRGVWTKEAVAREKDKAIEAKKRQLEDAFEYEDKEKQYKVNIDALEQKLVEANNEIIDLNSQLGFIGGKLKETENKFKSDFNVQMKYNAASENAMKKLEDKIEKRETTLRHVENMIGETVKLPERRSERDQMKIAAYRFAFIEDDLNRFIDKYKQLKEVEKQYEQMLQERDYILTHLGHHSTENKPTLLNAYRDFAIRTDEDMLNLKQALEKHHHTIENQQEKIQHLHKEVETHTEQKKMKSAGTVWQNAMMGLMRKQLNDVKYENRMKDTRIKHFETEMSKMRAKIGDLENQRREDGTTSRRNHSHRHRELASPRIEDDDDDSSTSLNDSKSRKNNLLPPLSNRLLYQGSENKVPQSQPILSPTRTKPKATLQKPMWQQNVSLPEGLLTHQLRLERRASEDMVHGMPPPRHAVPHGAVGLKMVHGKPSKYAHVRS